MGSMRINIGILGLIRRGRKILDILIGIDEINQFN